MTPPRIPCPELAERFQLEREFGGGEGWSGAVRDRVSGAELLLKVLAPEADLEEASLVASLDHPQIPRIVEAGRTADGTPFLLRAFVDGRSLDAGDTLDATAALELAEELLTILVFVHLRGVLHLDLKPANIVRREAAESVGSGRYVLLDFGLGRRAADGCAIGGTPFFQAPELALGLAPDERSDLFSLGATLFVLLRSSRPSLGAFLRSFPREDFFAAAGCDVSELPVPFDRWLSRLVARSPEQRFADAQEALEALDTVRGTGRPSLSALSPDPVAFAGDALDQFTRSVGDSEDVEIQGGESGDRRGLALHVAARLGGVRRIDDGAEATRLVRDGGSVASFAVRPLSDADLAAHLRSAVQLDEATAARAAQRMRAASIDSPAAVTRCLRELVESREIVPDGPRWIWPAALSGRSPDAPGAAVPQSVAALRDAAAAGRVEAALSGYRRLAAAAPERDAELRAALVAGLLTAGEAARALPLTHGLPQLRARALFELGRFDEARALADGDDGDDPTQARRVRAWLLYQAGNIDAALEQLEPGSADAEDVGLRGLFLAGSNRGDEARATLVRMLDRLEADERPFVRAAALTNLGELERATDLESAGRHHAEALELFRRLGNVRHTATASSNLGVVAKDLGRLGEALEHHRRARSLFEHVGDESSALIAEANLGIISLEAGDPRLALRRFTDARCGLHEHGVHRLDPLMDVLSARAHAALGERARAETLLASVDADASARIRAEVEQVTALLATSPTPSEDSSIEDRQVNDSIAPERTDVGGVISQAAFRTFLAVNKRLATGRDLQAAMRYLLDAAITLSGAREGYLLIADDSRLRLELATSESTDRAFSRSLANRAIQQQRVLSADDALADRDLMEMPSVRGLAVRSALCVPFRSSSASSGALYVEHSGRSGVFGEAEKELLEVLADQAAIAVDRLCYEDELAAQLKDSRRHLAVADRTLKRKSRTRMLGDSAPMQELARQIRKFAASDMPLVIWGETGSGKELVAQQVHAASNVADGPFLAENCSAIPEELIESELFGHVAGAFTGADTDRAGLLELASGGTLFLDEVGDMPMPMQLKLLRALQEGEIRRVGGRNTIPIRVRILSATHRDLRAMIESGEFREDLFYRIAAGELRVPPLRERGEDVVQIAHAVLERLNDEYRRNVRLSSDSEAVLCGYSWPGNVRELEHVISRAYLLSDGDELGLAPMPVSDAAVEAPVTAEAAWPVITLQEAEARTIRSALESTGGDKTKAARVLGISRTALYDKLKRIAGRD